MRNKLYWLFLAKIYWPCNNIYNNHRALLLRKNWGNAKVLFFNYEELALAAFTTLSKNRKFFLDPLDERYQVLLKRNYASWEYYPMPEPKRLEKLIQELFKNTEVGKKLLDTVERGRIQQLRDQFYRLTHPFT